MFKQLDKFFLESNKQTRIAISISAIGLLLFLTVAAFLPFKDQLFNLLYPKPSSFAEEKGWKTYDELVKEGKIKPAEPVIIVRLSYDVQKTPAVTVKKIQKIKGFPGTYPSVENGYMLQLLDSQNQVLYSFNFEIPQEIMSDQIVEENGKARFKGKAEKAKAVELQFRLPDYDNASQIKLLGPDKKLIDTKDLKNVPVEDNKPNFSSITGDEFLKSSSPKLLNLENLKRLFVKDSYALSTDNTYVDIVFIGDSYTDINAFNNDVNRFVDHLLTYEPFKSNSSRIVFMSVGNTSSLGCKFKPPFRLLGLDCDMDLIYQKVAESGLPWDNLYIIVNHELTEEDTIAGTGLRRGNIAYGANGVYGPQTFAHELGHSFGGLYDEYVYDFLKDVEGPSDNTTYVNCYGGTPPAADWAGIVAATDYRQGCYFPNWYASSQNSIMLDNSPYYNAISKIYLNQEINRFASQAPAPKPTPAPNCFCTYPQNCTDSNGLPGTQVCNGIEDQNHTCVWDYSGGCSANCTPCQATVKPTPPPNCSCEYPQSCTTSYGQTGVQTCWGIKNSSDICVWDNSGSCNPNCTICETSATAPVPKVTLSQNCTNPSSPALSANWNKGAGSNCNVYIRASSSDYQISTACSGSWSGSEISPGVVVVNGGVYQLFVGESSGQTTSSSQITVNCVGSPPPGPAQPCGSCPTGCDGDSNKSRCYASDGADMGCQPSYQCFIDGGGTCRWDPTNCTSDGGMSCLECKYCSVWACDERSTTRIETYEALNDPPGICASQWGGQSYGPKHDWIEKYQDNCEWNRQQGLGCDAFWGTALYDVKECICGTYTAETGISFSNPNPQPGETFTVEVTSFKRYDWDYDPNGGWATQEKRSLYLMATGPSGKISFGSPSVSSSRSVTRWAADQWRTYTQYYWQWNNVSLATAGSYTFKFYVDQMDWDCASGSLTVPITAPAAPKITTNVSCVSGPYNGSEVTISWNNPAGAPVSWVDISPNLYFNSYWNKNVSGLTSTTAPVGFSGEVSLLPDLVYYVRLYNGVHSPSDSFIIFPCPIDAQPPTAPTDFTAIPVSSSQINLSWTASTDNVGVTGYEIYRNSVKIATSTTTSYGDTGLAPSTTYTYFVKAYDGAGNISSSSNTVSVTTQPVPIYGSITGRVYSSVGGVVSGVRVSVKIGGSNKSYLTNSLGVFNITYIPPGTYSLEFKKSGYRTQNVSVNVTAGVTKVVNVTLIKR